MSVIGALDLSFTSTGFSAINIESKTIYTKSIRIGCKDKSFLGMQKSISFAIDEIEKEINKNKVDCLVIEEPFPGTIFSAGLYGLDSSVYQHFKTIIAHTFHPTVLRKIHGCKYTKKDSLTLAKRLIEELCLNDGFHYINEETINIETKKDLFGNKLTKTKHYDITHDESESLLYAIVTCIRFNNELFFKYKELLHTDVQHVCDW